MFHFLWIVLGNNVSELSQSLCLHSRKIQNNISLCKTLLLKTYVEESIFNKCQKLPKITVTGKETRSVWLQDWEVARLVG